MKRKCSIVLVLGCTGLLYGHSTALAQLSSFAVLGGSAVTNTATPTIVNGNLGVSPGSAVTGFPPGIVTGGTIHAADAVAAQAQSDLTTTYVNLANEACGTDLTGQDLGGKTLTPGVYCFSTSAQLTGALTLDAQGNPNAVFIFQIGSTLTTASSAVVRLTNGAQACAVFWQVGSSATLGTATHFQGNLMALTSITLTTGANILTGRALARNGALTLHSNRITPPVGACTFGSGSGGGSGGTPSVPGSGSGGTSFVLPALLVIGGGVAVEVGRRQRRAGQFTPRS